MMTSTLDTKTRTYPAPGRTEPMTDDILQIENLSVSFDGFKAINDLSLRMSHNELRVIIGPNGAGKTTLLDIICGKTKPNTGRVMFGGDDLTKLGEHQIVRRGVARKFQTPSTYEDLSVLENFEISIPRGRGVFGSLLFRRDKAVMERVSEIAGEVF